MSLCTGETEAFPSADGVVVDRVVGCTELETLVVSWSALVVAVIDGSDQAAELPLAYVDEWPVCHIEGSVVVDGVKNVEVAVVAEKLLASLVLVVLAGNVGESVVVEGRLLVLVVSV